MTTKRILTIITVLILLATVFLGVAWYVNRKNAEKNGTTPLTFRQFLGVGTPNAPGQSGDGELAGEFTGGPQKTIKYDENNNGINDWLEDLNNNGLIDGTEDFNNNGIPDGQEDADDTDITPLIPDGTPNESGGFTGEVITPEGGNPGGNGNPGGSGGGGDNNPGGGDGDEDEDGGGFGEEEDVPGDPDTGIVNTQGCSAQDVNIVFTEEELIKLKALQVRFNTISATLYDVPAVNEQKTYYDRVAIKRDQMVDLKNFCNNTVTQINDGIVSSANRRVPTPFYHNSTQDKNTFTNYTSYFSDHNDGTPSNRKPILSHPENLISFFERVLRLNIW